MKKILSILLLCTLLVSAMSLSVGAIFGSGVEVVAKDVELIKTGLLGEKLKFSDSDFKSLFCITDFEKITLTKLPSSNDGVLLLAGRRVGEGTSIKRKNIAALVFVPLSKDITESEFSFTLTKGNESFETKCKMKFIDKINYPPEVKKEGDAKTSITTQSEISVYGRLNGTDPEGDEIEYIIVSYPKNGSIRITDNETGKFKYTPTKSFTGYDSFTYVVRDSYGNYSYPEEVSVKIIERMTTTVYKDMSERSEYNAAVAMNAMGVMSGKLLGDDNYFMPDEVVTRAEFLSMAMKAYGIKKDSSLTKTFYDDDAEIPVSLRPYVATATRLGIVNGSFDNGELNFEPNRPITSYECASIISKITGKSAGEEETVFNSAEDVPVWARGSVSVMITLGIFDKDEPMTDTVTRATAAEYLYRMIKNA